MLSFIRCRVLARDGPRAMSTLCPLLRDERKDFRRIATRYDRLARNYLASVCNHYDNRITQIAIDLFRLGRQKLAAGSATTA